MILLVATFGWVMALAAAAEAHTVAGESASNYRTTVSGLRAAVRPPSADTGAGTAGAGTGTAGAGAGTNGAAATGPEGQGSSGAGTAGIDIAAIDAAIDLEAVENGGRLRLVVRGDHTVVVGGYEDDIYLRLDRGGVWENTRSSAAYLNDDRAGTAAPPPGVVDPAAEPDWEHVAEAGARQVVALWHDHRAHWMGDREPPAVRAAPGTSHRIYDWTVPLTVDGQQINAFGTLDWVPGPSPLPWVVLAAGLGVAVAAGGLLWSRRAAVEGGRQLPATPADPASSAAPGRSRSGWGLPLAVAAVTVVAADVTHAALAAAADAEDPVGAFLWGNGVEMAVWVLGLGAAGLLLRRSVTGLYLAASAGFVLALVGGLADVDVLYRSGAPVAGPIGLTRALTSATIGIGLGLVVAAALANRRSSSDHTRTPATNVGADEDATAGRPAQ